MDSKIELCWCSCLIDYCLCKDTRKRNPTEFQSLNLSQSRVQLSLLIPAKIATSSPRHLRSKNIFIHLASKKTTPYRCWYCRQPVPPIEASKFPARLFFCTLIVEHKYCCYCPIAHFMQKEIPLQFFMSSKKENHFYLRLSQSNKSHPKNQQCRCTIYLWQLLVEFCFFILGKGRR